MTNVTNPSDLLDEQQEQENTRSRTEGMINRINKEVTSDEDADEDRGLTSMWDKAKGYCDRASEAVGKRARKVQGRSARADAQNAADKAEKVMGNVTATVVGLVKAGTAITVGGVKGTLSGSARATQPGFVTAIHAADDIAIAGKWTGEVRQKTDDGVPYDVAAVSMRDDVANVVDMNTRDVIQLGRAVETRMEIGGKKTNVIVKPLFEEENMQAVGCLILENEEDGEDRVFIHFQEE